MADNHGEIVVSASTPTVEPPDTAYANLALLADPTQVRVMPDGMTLFVGHDHDGEPIYYRVVGWDDEHLVLVLRRDRDARWPRG